MTLGFKPPEWRPLGEESSSTAVAALIASLALVVAILTVVIAVSGAGYGSDTAHAAWLGTLRG